MSALDAKILAVEDNPGELFLEREFLERTSLSTFEILHADTLKRVTDGRGAKDRRAGLSERQL
jgi:hypothetical protein